MENVVQNGRETDALLSYKNGEKVVVQRKLYKTSQNGNNVTEETQQIQVPFHYKAIRTSLYILFKVVNVAYIPLYIYRAFETPKKCPPIKDEILTIPASELAEKIRKKEISCEKVIRAYISRINEVNPLLNAVIEDRFSEAIEEAKKVDELVSSEDFSKNETKLMETYPLLGVPLTVKGSISVSGLKNTSGMITRKDVTSQSDAIAVMQARKAGAIPLLVSNVPELCMNWETVNKLVGTTKNPHDTTRTCGGSSGGEASLLAAGASLIGIGSDIAGSLRLPAHYCGVWGHKPTPGMVSAEGHYPSCANYEKWEAAFTLGPMARYVGDLRTLLRVISVPEKRERLGLDQKVDVSKIRIYYTENLDSLLCDTPNKHCTGAVQKVIGYFSRTCEMPAKKVDFHLMQYAPELASLALIDIDDVDNIFDNNGNGAFAELLRYATFQSKHTIMTIFYGLLKKLHSFISRENIENVEKHLKKLKNEFEVVLGDEGVFILPTFTSEALKHGDSLRKPLHSGYMSIFNALGFPVTNCPVGVSSEGLPVGVQVVSLPYNDKLTLSIAEEIEKAFGGWKPPQNTL